MGPSFINTHTQKPILFIGRGSRSEHYPLLQYLRNRQIKTDCDLLDSGEGVLGRQPDGLDLQHDFKLNISYFNESIFILTKS